MPTQQARRLRIRSLVSQIAIEISTHCQDKDEAKEVVSLLPRAVEWLYGEDGELDHLPEMPDLRLVC